MGLFYFIYIKKEHLIGNNKTKVIKDNLDSLDTLRVGVLKTLRTLYEDIFSQNLKKYIIPNKKNVMKKAGFKGKQLRKTKGGQNRLCDALTLSQ